VWRQGVGDKVWETRCGRQGVGDKVWETRCGRQGVGTRCGRQGVLYTPMRLCFSFFEDEDDPFAFCSLFMRTPSHSRLPGTLPGACISGIGDV
jgi:hypothetical protein